ncbi:MULTISPECIES: hypothetical protein [Acinetobacter]|jgi:putative effector of murein hydrolase LrgA (UPF0299 family)|uniref:Antiholin-like protein LrgA n=1 Tax=Acinetobacter guillouiae NIPH 991 TaxID=1217656 RepID=N8X1U4_ACIGI|nr:MULTISPECIES: hypothetical protein [Acinetobacter]ENU58892.1 hypothetical protein F981_03200 [Acinetobacter guillouiae CIP 63.46]ENV18377.1 hypothetical protein F964_01702 [Acinetobacter guillouiae NIPH 991]EPH38139.1 Antiholin-like protein LrgA [Acinetobacter guillouiae MSP4-18]KAB0625645.1 hypothetical protein F7P82_15125 [Acinetobacter guillouiae]MBP2544512.1 putative effector of murein hydrolase LrgA (UPF0299 family) [Acinetobacter guillouiae]
MDQLKGIDWQAWIFTIGLIIFFREASVLVMSQFNHPELGNLTGLLSLLFVLVIWRRFKKIPARLVDTNNKLMRESGFAFLPICAGSLIMLVSMGKEIPLFLVVMFVSTLIPLWIYAKMAKKWL